MDLANKDRMLTMYESSMADLSTKVHLLKKTLEEKVKSEREGGSKRGREGGKS